MAASGVVRNYSKSGRSSTQKRLKPGDTFRKSDGTTWRLSKSGRSYSQVK